MTPPADPCIEHWPELSFNGRFPHAFLGRVPGLEVAVEREAALTRLVGTHAAVRQRLGLGAMPLITATQVHGREVAVVEAATPVPVEGVDALVTASPGVCLGIYVADCGALYAVDHERGVIGLAHSGRKGTELGVVPAMLTVMTQQFGSRPGAITVALGPCIRPPHYEVDFAAEIGRQCREFGVGTVIDHGTCTASHPERYYSYRMEKGRTGRMLALLAIKP